MKDLQLGGEDSGRILKLIDDVLKTGATDRDAQNTVEAGLRILYKNRDQNDMIAHAKEKFGDYKALGLIDTIDETKISGWNVDQLANKVLARVGMEDKLDRVDSLRDLGQIAAGNGGIGHGFTKIDKATGE